MLKMPSVLERVPEMYVLSGRSNCIVARSSLSFVSLSHTIPVILYFCALIDNARNILVIVIKSLNII